MGGAIRFGSGLRGRITEDISLNIRNLALTGIVEPYLRALIAKKITLR